MRIFKNTWFTRFAGKEGITDSELRELTDQLEAGQADANMGGDVYKMRISRPGEGKSGGYRVIVFFRSEDKTFFVYGFAKSDRDNIDQKEKSDYKELAKKYLNLSDEMIDRAVKSGKFIEI
ncbi:MAG: type II toxin-antitoxin system RelE/ParE family toxin [Treponema sp.]|nr:type II toxin-antitoxin system RelE/ParE family toxin [Treponema sp.]